MNWLVEKAWKKCSIDETERSRNDPGGSSVPHSCMNAGRRESSLPIWGISQNPLIYRNLVILAAQTSPAEAGRCEILLPPETSTSRLKDEMHADLDAARLILLRSDHAEILRR